MHLSHIWTIQLLSLNVKVCIRLYGYRRLILALFRFNFLLLLLLLLLLTVMLDKSFVNYLHICFQVDGGWREVCVCVWGGWGGGVGGLKILKIRWLKKFRIRRVTIFICFWEDGVFLLRRGVLVPYYMQ